MKKLIIILWLTAFVIGIGFAQDFVQNTLNQRKPVITDRDLVIQIADITENALFFPVVVDGMQMEVLAVRTPDGVIRTAFNTCQVCYNSGKGYFVQVDTVLICQNCSRRFRMNQVERQAGGCNPVPIFPADKTVTASTVTISKEYLQRAKTIFASWRQN
jgi:uncharacterized membrane protein